MLIWYILINKLCFTCHLPCQRYEKLNTQAPELHCIKVEKALQLVGMNLIGMFADLLY